MTTQQPDIVVFNTNSFHLMAARGDGLTRFRDLNLQLSGPSNVDTTLNRNNIITYRVDQYQLYLDKLYYYGFYAKDKAKTLNGVTPTPYQGFRPNHKLPEAKVIAYAFEQVDLPVAFTGQLLIGIDFLPDYGSWMVGSSEPFAFELVLALYFEDGRLGEVKDHSEGAAHWRDWIVRRNTGTLPAGAKPPAEMRALTEMMSLYKNIRLY
ncbi:MAG: hypothetical protein AAF125_08300 [Chloroflexota bacterium]